MLIEGKPAWRAGSDFHACLLVDPPSQPHVGGMVAMGSSTVLINGLPAARMGDFIVESGVSPNSIALGSMKVLIGP